MLENALAAVRGRAVSSASLWQEHAAIARQIEEIDAELRQAENVSREHLVESLATQNEAARRKIRLRLDDLRHRRAELHAVQTLLASKASEAEEEERQRAEREVWHRIDAAIGRRREALAEIEQHVRALCESHIDVLECEREIELNIPKHCRPSSWVSGGWGPELGRFIAQHIKRLSPSIDLRSNGLWGTVSREIEPISAIGELSLRRLLAKRPEQERENAV